MIVIGTSEGRELWWRDCLASMPDDIPVLLVSQYAYELGKIRWVLEHTNIQRFWLLQDSVVIHDATFLRDALQSDHAVSLCQHPDLFGMFMGVYDRHILNQVGVPTVIGKEHSIQLERTWTRHYAQACQHVQVMFSDFNDTNAIGEVERYGRNNLVLSNDHLTKYKGTWA